MRYNIGILVNPYWYDGYDIIMVITLVCHGQ